MARGYRRREADAWRHTRLLATIQTNIHRGQDDPALTPEEFMALPGDVLPERPHQLTPEQVEADFARTADLDKDLF
jgi:hypothetical protein